MATSPTADGRPGGQVSRRAVLSGAAAASGALLVGCSTDGSGNDAAGAGGEAVATAASRYLPFRGERQSGLTASHQAYGLLAAVDLTAPDIHALRETFQRLTTESERVMGGVPYEDRDPDYPPLYTGTVGNPPPPADLSVTFAVGASLFDDRYGLAPRRPRDLVLMPSLANDRLDPGRSHGDLLLSISSASEDVNLFALRQLVRVSRATMALRWMLQGFNRRVHADPGEAGVRNLMGFVDGTSNLDPADGAQMDELVFVADGDDEPAWTAGGSYQVVRVIRMLVESWDRARLGEQEALIGRRKSNGAPLDGDLETDEPDFEADPHGEVTPLDAHIRLANPRTAETAGQRLLRRGFSYSRGFDGDGQLDQGLAFVSYQRSLERQFMPIADRLDGEPLEQYLRPEGGGYYFVLPGATEDSYLGQGLIEG